MPLIKVPIYCPGNVIFRKGQQLFFKQQSGLSWTLLYALDRYAPNGIVRRRVRKIDEKYRTLLGEPTPAMEATAKALEGMATIFRIKEFFDPMNRHPKEEPFKRYTYDNGNNNGNGAIPYTTEWPTGTPVRTKLAMQTNELKGKVLGSTIKAIRRTKWRKSDPEIDEFLQKKISDQVFSVGF